MRDRSIHEVSRVRLFLFVAWWTFVKLIVFTVLTAIVSTVWYHFYTRELPRVIGVPLFLWCLAWFVFGLRVHHVRRAAAWVGRHRRMTGISAALALVLVSSACFDGLAWPSAHTRGSQIVKAVAAAGAGDPAHFSERGLQIWFSQRSDVADRIAGECGQLRERADAEWANTPEGMVCQAAATSSAWHFRTPVAGGRSW
jgi:hypothetical protein